MQMSLLSDVRLSFRTLVKNPGFTAVAVATLALGIGVNATVFTVTNAVLFKGFPLVERNDRLLYITPKESNCCVSYPDFLDYRAQARSFEEMAIVHGVSKSLSDDNGFPENLDVTEASAGTFHVVGQRPIIGRDFAPADETNGAAPVAMLNYTFWERRYGKDPSIIGRTVRLNGTPTTVIGVMPRGFSFPQKLELWVPLVQTPKVMQRENRDTWMAIGRMAQGVTVESAQAEMDTIGKRLAIAYPLSNRDIHPLVQKFHEFFIGPNATLLYGSMWSAVGFVLLIACANLANLMLARASAREKEIAVRLALGASRGRLIRQLLSESLLLAVAGATAGILLARVLSGVLVAMISTQSDTMFLDLAPDYRVLGFTAGLAVLTCILFGLAPALRATKSSPASAMRASGRGLTANRERFGLRRILVVTQVALSLVLLVGALLFTGSLRNLMSVDAGFRQDGILVTDLGFESLKIPQERRIEYRRQLLDKVRSIPGVISAANNQITPLSGSGWNQTIFIDGKKKGGSSLNRVTPGYFATLGMPLVAGRDFDNHDAANGVQVAIVNEAFAKKYFDGANPVGKTFGFEGDKGEVPPVFEIVGMVKNSKYYELREDFKPVGFFPDTQDKGPGQYANILIRADIPLTALVAAVKRSVAEVSPDIDIEFHPFKTQIMNGLLRERLMATLSGFFGALAALLAVIGLYGVISYMVARRTNEIGIRMALGADPGGIVRLILREALLLLGIGLIAGAGLALAAARTAASMLFGLKPYDPATLAFAIGALALVAIAASYIPARRAAGVDPMVALREE